MMKKYIILVVLAATVIVIAVRAMSSPSVVVRDVCQGESIILGQVSERTNVYALLIRGSGVPFTHHRQQKSLGPLTARAHTGRIAISTCRRS